MLELIEEIASVLPDDKGDPSQYHEMVHYWFSEKGQENKTNTVLRLELLNRPKSHKITCLGRMMYILQYMDKKIYARDIIFYRHKSRSLGTCKMVAQVSKTACSECSKAVGLKINMKYGHFGEPWGYSQCSLLDVASYSGHIPFSDRKA